MKNKLQIKIILLVSSSLTVMSGATIAPSLPQMAEIFSDTPHAEFLSKLILTIPALFVAIGSPVAGRIADRVGRLPLLWFTLVLYVIGGTSGYYLDDLYLILCGRAVLGLAVAGVMTATVTLVGDYMEGKEREQFMGFQGAFMAFGGVVFVGTGGLLADISWRAPFLMYCFSLLVLGGARMYLYEPEVEKETVTVGVKPSRFSLTHVMLFGTVMVLMAFFYLIPVQIPFYLKEIGIQKNALAGLAIVSMTSGAVVTSMLYRRVRRFLSFPAVFAVSCLGMAIGFTVISQAQSYGVVLTGLLITGLGGGLFMPNSNVWLLSITPPGIRGTAVGLLTTFIFVGQFLSPLMVVPLMSYMALDGVFFTGACGLAGLSLWYVVNAFLTRSRQHAREPL